MNTASSLSALPTPERDERQALLMSDAADLAGDVSSTSKLIGYVMLAYYSDGATRTAGWRPNSQDHAIGSAMWEAWCRATLAKHFVYGEGIEAAHAVWNGEA